MIKVRNDCTGCIACKNICPVRAIGSSVDRYGFMMPAPDRERCIGCGLCEAVCPILPAPRACETKMPLHAYSMYHLSDEVLQKSSSGGVFYELACRVLNENGIVFGCRMDAGRKLAYLTDTDHTPLETLLTSKYVESYVGNGFRRIRKNLESGRKVLFCGTPCQAAGLVRYLRKPYENLLTVDFTCGGVASQIPLRRHLRNLEKRFRSTVKNVRFRSKHYGWGQNCFTAEFENGRIYRKTAMSDPFYYCFLRSSMQRLSCHGCPFSDHHASDIVLADFWKCRSFPVDQNGRKGLSLALAMTEKGKIALENLSGRMHMEEIDRKDASYNLKSRVCPPEKLPEIYRDQLWAVRRGVTSLRRRLLSRRQRLWFAFRQFVMDRPALSVAMPGAAGRGQIMEPEQKPLKDMASGKDAGV